MPEDTEDLELLTSGRARAVIDGKTYTLKRPTMGQLRHFREGMEDLAQEMGDLIRTKHPTVVLAGEGHEVAVENTDDLWLAKCTECDATSTATIDRETQDRWAERHRTETVDDERRVEVHQEWRQGNVDYTDHVVGWVRGALDALAEPKLNGLSNDDLPAWAGEQDVANALYKHWRERPFNSGGQ